LAEEQEYAPPDEWASIDLIYDFALKELEVQEKAWEDADRRLQLLLGFVGVIFAAAMGLGTGQAPPSALVRALVLGATVALLFSAVTAVGAYLPRRFARPTSIRQLREGYLTAAERETKRVMVDTLIVAYDRNETVVREKLGFFKLGLLSFAASVILLATAIVVRSAPGL
jgi:hypothetical protein